MNTTATGQPLQVSPAIVDNQTHGESTWDNSSTWQVWKDSSSWHEDEDWKHSGKSSWQEQPSWTQKASWPENEDESRGGGGKGGGSSDTRPGDWECPVCGINVFASKDACFKCGATKDRKLPMAGSTQTPRRGTPARDTSSWDSWRQSQAGAVAVQHTNWSSMFSSSIVEAKPVLFMHKMLDNKGKTKQLSDEDVSEIAYELEFRQLPSFRQQWNLRPLSPLNMDELDLGNQGLQDSGVTSLLKAMMEHCVTVKSLKLYRNHVSSAGREAVGELIAKAEKPPAEIHLSHNLLGPSDIWC